MKNRYIISIVVSLLFLFNTSRAQTNLTQAVDFTVTDVNGVVHNLFDILNNGQHVCIDFFFDACVPCQQTSPFFKQSYTNFGCNTEDIFFIAIDLGDTDAQVIAYENTFLGGAPGYPSVSGIDGGGNAVVSAYGIVAFPTYILIRSDQMIIEQDMWPIANASTFTSYFAGNGLSPVACTVGINENNAFEGTSVYPNPATDLLNVKSDLDIQTYRIFNLLGEEVLAGEMNSAKLDVSGLHSGIYLLEFIYGNQSGKFRFARH
ncbi:MAG: T9SS type A sorting domain-containing protein [Bacteroidota bacterium]|nr:T9SS type A sorting domain-containing protein [Bacteroidota bacterium]